MQILINIFYFVIVMGLIVFIHELGHLIAAKAFGVYCNEFAIGMGPKIFQYKKEGWETSFSIRAFPLGGFVSMAGEPGEGDFGVERERTVVGIKPWKRLIVMLAGIFMNFVLALVIFSGIFMYSGIVDQPEPVIAGVQVNSPADKAGLQVNDEIVKLTFDDGKVVVPKDFNQLVTSIMVYEDHEVTVTVLRNGQEVDTKLTPEYNAEQERYLIGVQAVSGEHRDLNFFQAIGAGFNFVGFLIQQLGFVLNRLVHGVGFNSVGGPIGIYQATSKISTDGWFFFLNLVGQLSVSLAVINLVPIPVMDGGRALLTLIEMIIRRPIPEKIENGIMAIGVAMIMALFVFVMFNDIRKLIG
ncbi:M50 family metallopeptidase [Erysipelothrix tonsillarum]|uniref:M50 family metallopeptidase n=1 Tax=Erysipelothrix tonsillarum TaxID=38402 RepID=UPI0003692612|nr:M50 family metallopeptidase [Erysipelothrix tonsillarum]